MNPFGLGKALGHDYFEFKVTGLKEMEAQLLQLPAKVARNALAVAVNEGARVIRDAARPKAPVGTKTYKDYRGKTHHPGLLRRFGVVTKKMKARDWRTTVLYGVGFSKRGFYGKWIERGKSRKHHQAPKPFVVPLLGSLKEQVVNAIKIRLGKRLEEIIKATPGMRVR